jgi:hypothetical protein
MTHLEMLREITRLSSDDESGSSLCSRREQASGGGRRTRETGRRRERLGRWEALVETSEVGCPRLVDRRWILRDHTSKHTHTHHHQIEKRRTSG